MSTAILDTVVDLSKPAGEGMVRGVILHVPAHPAQQRVGAGAARVLQDVGDVRQPEMLDRVLQLMHRLGQQHRRQPIDHRRPTAGRQRHGGDRRVTGEVPARFAHHIVAARRLDVRLGDDAARKPHDAAPARVPVRRPQHPPDIRPQRVAVARQFAVAVPVLRMPVVRSVL